MRTDRAPTLRRLLFLLTLSAASFVGCVKLSESFSDRLAGFAGSRTAAAPTLQIAGNGVRATSVDGQGHATSYEVARADLGEAELGAPLYPGARLPADGGTRLAGASSELLVMRLGTRDAPAMVAAFYREQLRARADGRQLIDLTEPDGEAVFLLTRADSTAIQVRVRSDADGGSEITLTAQRSPRPAQS
ncbi:hypothetical protein [Derxia gummosa]|uniref:Lipoprotein n=1 Tax=Derxia gummosa DSM 723 TaxID=1121388 RepID=A0A8B6X663_9BURK|nr:hypothetical protein [Derxia gummosa]